MENVQDNNYVLGLRGAHVGVAVWVKQEGILFQCWSGNPRSLHSTRPSAFGCLRFSVLYMGRVVYTLSFILPSSVHRHVNIAKP